MARISKERKDRAFAIGEIMRYKGSRPTLFIQREIHRHHYYIVVRDRGRIVSMRRAIKGFSLQRGRDIYKENNTLWEGYKRTFLAKVVAHEDFRKGARLPKGSKFHITAEADIDGKIIAASSRQGFKGKRYSRMLAVDSLSKRIASVKHIDTDEVKEMIAAGKIRVRIAVAWFTRK